MKNDELHISKETYSGFIKLAGYQIIGGAIGIAIIIWLVNKTADITAASVLLLTLMMLLFSFSFFCGVRLIQAKAGALKLSLINQCLQVFGFAILGYAFNYVAGLYLSVEFDLTEAVNIHVGFGISKFALQLNSDSATTAFSFNIIALLVIFWISKLMKEVKTEMEIDKAATIGTDVIPENIENC